MKNQRSYPDPRSHGSRDAFAADGDDGKGKGMWAAEHEKRKDRSPSPFADCAGMHIDEVVTPGTWTGEKKTKNQRDADRGGIDEQPDKKAHAVDDAQNWLKSIEEYKWDDYRLESETTDCLNYLNDHHVCPPGTFGEMDENQYIELMSRLALYRIRAHEGDELKDMDIDKLSEQYPWQELDNEAYYVRYEWKFRWFFDPKSFGYSGFDDYQRLVIRTSETAYIDGISELARVTRCTLEGDKQYLEFWNKLSNDIKWYRKLQWFRKPQTVAVDVKKKLDRVAYYRSLKIGREFPQIRSTLIFAAFGEYKLRVEHDDHVDDDVSLYFELWKLVAKEKTGLRKAMEQLLAEEKVPLSCSFSLKYELNKGSGPLSANYERFIAGIDGKLNESDAFPLIKKVIGEMRERMKTYCDYAEEKLKIAEEIGVIAYLTKQNAG